MPISKTFQNTANSGAFTKVCAFLCTFTIMSNTDSLESITLPEVSRRQNQLIKVALGESARYHVQGKAKSGPDVCRWKQIECTDGIATCMWAYNLHPHLIHLIQVEWLPPTMQLIHLYNIRVPKIWDNMILPRDLRYLFLGACHDPGSRTKGFAFYKLPRRMEELILFDSNISGIIRLDDMPETMRFLFLRVDPRVVKGILVNYDNLPGALESLYAQSMHIPMDKVRKLNIKEVGRPRTVKLQTMPSPVVLLDESNYYEQFEKKIIGK